MTTIKNSLDYFAQGYEEITGDILHPELRANLKRTLLAGVLGMEYDPEIMARAILAYGKHTGHLTGLVHSPRIMLTTFNRYQGLFGSENHSLSLIYRARNPHNLNAPTGKDLKELRTELQAGKWIFCPGIDGKGVYVFAP